MSVTVDRRSSVRLYCKTCKTETHGVVDKPTLVRPFRVYHCVECGMDQWIGAAP